MNESNLTLSFFQRACIRSHQELDTRSPRVNRTRPAITAPKGANQIKWFSMISWQIWNWSLPNQCLTEGILAVAHKATELRPCLPSQASGYLVTLTLTNRLFRTGIHDQTLATAMESSSQHWLRSHAGVISPVKSRFCRIRAPGSQRGMPKPPTSGWQKQSVNALSDSKQMRC